MAAEQAEPRATASAGARPMHGELMERVLERDNLERALKQVRRNQGAPDIEPPNQRPPPGADRRGAERHQRHPAWLESVLRHHRSAEPSARAGQVDSATVTLLRMEAMGIEGLPGTAKAGRVRARSMEREQERPRPMANLEDPGTVVGDADEFLQRDGLATTGTRQSLMRMHSTQRTAVYVTRTHGGVGGRGRKVPSYPD
jgi:hypothetical protein